MATANAEKVVDLKSAEEMNLKSTNPLFDKYFEEWRFLNAAYEGVRALIAYGALYRHERESKDNYDRRMAVAYGFSYSKSIVDIFNSYLFKKEFPKELPESLTKDDQWKAFQKDCNLEGDEFDDFFIDEQRHSSILGHIGLLVDKPNTEMMNRKEEKDAEVYPYVVAYKPMAILDWKYERDETGRRILTYLKVLDDDDRYRVWTLDKWQIWQLATAQSAQTNTAGVNPIESVGQQKQKSEITGKGTSGVLVEEGENPLGEIPWVWLFNQKSNIDKEVGVSDIVDVARIDASIIRNLSQIEEIIDYAAFPMMRKPMKEVGAPAGPDEAGPTAILEFDPDKPESKPDWLEATVDGPVKAIIDVIKEKVGEIYRSSNIGGMSATEISKSAKSGVALKTEFQLLNSKLVKKGKNVVKAKKKVTEFWLKWQDEWDRFRDEIKYDHIQSFEVQDMVSDLENILTSTVLVTGSGSYKTEIQKLVVRMILPMLDDEKLAIIDKEIEDGLFEGLGSFFAQEAAGMEEQEGQPPQGFVPGDEGAVNLDDEEE